LRRSSCTVASDVWGSNGKFAQACISISEGRKGVQIMNFNDFNLNSPI
jgi:hypothetical protein